MKVANKIAVEAKDIEESRLKIVEEFCAKGADGKCKTKDKQFELKDKKGFEKKWGEFMDSTIEVDVWSIPLSYLDKIEISAEVLGMIDCLIEDDTEKKK